MKTIAVFLAVAGLAVAVPHRHAHMHLHAERQAGTPTTDVVAIAGPTVIRYELNGALIDQAEVEQGLQNGTLVFENGAPAVASPAATPVEDYATAAATTAPATSAAEQTSTSDSAPTTAAAAPSSAATISTISRKKNSNNNNDDSESGNVGATFPDGQIDCSTFPSAYGAVALDYLGVGGWAGVQNPGNQGDSGYSSIITQSSATCSGSDCCGEGMFCSYACPAGYQKSQWPTLQGSTLESVGGLQCKGGKLHLTNSNFQQLCISGAEEVKVYVQNNNNGNVAVCRTDYPGTESETIPVSVAAGSKQPLTCPNEATYYQWAGKPTSAQYYVNKVGIDAQDACQWSNSGSEMGNWAPLNLGVGYTPGDGLAYLSLMQNMPTTNTPLPYKVSIISADPANYPISGECYYDGNGGYHSGSGTVYSDSLGAGCTVSIASGGTALFVLGDA